jgi:hypothetical protein
MAERDKIGQRAEAENSFLRGLFRTTYTAVRWQPASITHDKLPFIPSRWALPCHSWAAT